MGRQKLSEVKMKIFAATLIAANAEVVKLTMRTADSSNTSKQGASPQLLVKTCDGRVKFSDTTYSTLSAGQSKSWTVNNFDLETDMIEFEASNNDGWLVQSMEMQICDDSGNNCQAQPVQEDYQGVKDSGNMFWIDGNCSFFGGHDEDGCHDTHVCN